VGYEGYATNKMPTDFGGFFHAEIMICDPKDILSPRQVTDETKVNKIIENYKLNRLARQTEENRQLKRKQKKRVFENEEENISNFNLGFSKISNNSFSNTLFNSPPSSPSRTPEPMHKNNLFNFSPSPNRKTHKKSPTPITPMKGGRSNKKRTNKRTNKKNKKTHKKQ
jgi:hypothetical protein